MCMRFALPVVAIVFTSMAVTGCSLDKPAGLHSLGGLAHWKSKLGLGSSQTESAAKGPLALAQLSERRNQADRAKHLYQIVIEREPQNPFPHQRLGVMSAKEGKFEEAHQHFQKSLALGPGNHKLLSDIGYCFYLQHRLNESEESLRRALQIEPNDRAACNNLAIVLGEMERYDECLAMFQKVGTEAEAYANLGFLLAQRGEFDRAKDNYNRALTLDPELRPAAEALAQLVGGKSRLDRAVALNGPVRRYDAGAVQRSDDGYPAQRAAFEQVGTVGQPREASAAHFPPPPLAGPSTRGLATSAWTADMPRPRFPTGPAPFGGRGLERHVPFPSHRFPNAPTTVTIPVTFQDDSPVAPLPPLEPTGLLPQDQPGFHNPLGTAWAFGS